MTRPARIFLLLLVTSFLCSCASAKLVDTWRNPALHPARPQKVLVVSITNKESSRKVYEDILASELQRQGVQAVPSYTLIPIDVKPESALLEKAVHESAAQEVLTLQTIKVEKQTTVQPGYVTTYPGHWYPEAFPTWDLYGYYGSMANYGPAYISTYDIATMQVNLFDAATGKLLWAATVTSDEPEKVVPVGKALAEIVVKSLKKEGFI